MFRLCWWFWGCCLGCEGGGVVVYFGGARLDLGFEDAVLVVSCDGGEVAYFGGVRLDLGFEDAVCWCSDAW